MLPEIRIIQKEDNHQLARVIRSILEEFNVAGPGTVYTDSSTDNLFELFQKKGAIYYTSLYENEIIGGCGIYHTEGLPDGYAELVKLYVRGDFSGKGLGKKLMIQSMEYAKEFGYKSLYLETMPELAGAIELYRSLGFEEISGPLGNTGHFACEVRMVVEL